MNELFKIENSTKADRNCCLIKTEYESLCDDGDIDILFTGKNTLGVCIIGNILCEAEENNVWMFRYLHIVITPKEYSDFINRAIDYRSLIEKQKDVFIIDTDINENLIEAHFCPLQSIPPNYLPIAGIVFCPS